VERDDDAVDRPFDGKAAILNLGGQGALQHIQRVQNPFKVVVAEFILRFLRGRRDRRAEL
jgi:hypothetical protein